MESARRRLLCVEDDPDTCAMIVMLLGLSQLDVQTAHTAAEALRLARGQRFDLYLLDNRLPDGSGLELCRELHHLSPGTPVIFMSGLAHELDCREGLAAGARAYLTKPVDPAELERVIFQALGDEGLAA